MAVYLVDTENVYNTWQDIMCLVRPDDKIMLFYTDKSPNVHMDEMEFLCDCNAEIKYIKCHRTGLNCDNALDFQLVSELGYLIHENMSLGKAECYFLVSRDGGYDSVVEYWTRRNIFIQRLVAEGNAAQNIPAGPMLDPDSPTLTHPLAVKPNFAMIRRCGNMFRLPLTGTEYYRFNYEIAKVFVLLWNMNLPADRFVLRFRNAMSIQFGVKNDVYKLLKPTMDSMRSVIPESSKSEQEFDSDSDSGQEKPAAGSEHKIDMQRLSEILNRKGPSDFRAAIAAPLPKDLKFVAPDIVKMQALSMNRNISVWQADYTVLLRSYKGVPYARLPDSLRKVNYQRWPKTIRADILDVLGR